MIRSDHISHSAFRIPHGTPRALILVFALLAAALPSHAITVTDRYAAVLSACRARRAAGIMTPEIEGLCRNLTEARAKRKSARVLELLTRIEVALAANAPEQGSLAIKVDEPDAGVLFRPRVLSAAQDLVVLDLDALDDLALRDRLALSDSRDIVCPLNTAPAPPLEAGPRLLPPEGWEEYAARLRHLRRVMAVSGLERLIALPAIPADRPDISDWIASARDSFPGQPILVDGILEQTLALPGETWILRIPGKIAARDMLESFRTLAFSSSTSTALAFEDTAPGADILLSALESMGPELRVRTFLDDGVLFFRSGTRMILLTRLARAVLATLLSGSAQEMDCTIVDMTDRGELAFRQVRGASPLAFSLPSRAIVFIEVAFVQPRR